MIPKLEFVVVPPLVAGPDVPYQVRQSTDGRGSKNPQYTDQEDAAGETSGHGSVDPGVFSTTSVQHQFDSAVTVSKRVAISVEFASIFPLTLTLSPL